MSKNASGVPNTPDAFFQIFSNTDVVIFEKTLGVRAVTRNPMKEAYFNTSHNTPTEYLQTQGLTCEV